MTIISIMPFCMVGQLYEFIWQIDHGIERVCGTIVQARTVDYLVAVVKTQAVFLLYYKKSMKHCAVL